VLWNGGAVGCGAQRRRPSRPGAQVPYACDPRAVRGTAATPKGRWMTEGQGELRFDSETQTRNEQNQVRASLERLCERLAEW
jgi:hypothetical protein